MSRRLAITEAQIRAICNGAAKANEPHIPIVEIGNAVIRLVPASMSTQKDETGAKGKGYL